MDTPSTDQAKVVTVDLVPTWEAVLGIYLAVLENPKARASAQAEARGQLRRMAILADRYLAARKAETEA